MVIAAVLLVGGFAAMLWYTHRRTTHAFNLGPRGKRAAAWLLFLGVVALVLARVGARFAWMEAAAVPLGLVGAVVTLAVVMAFPLLVGIDAIGHLFGFASKLGTRGAAAPVATAPAEVLAAPKADAAPDPSRRVFVARGAQATALLSASSTASYATLFGRHDYSVENLTVVLPHLPRELDGLTVVQLSDIHFGAFVGDEERRRAESLVRDAKPDLVVLTGDLIDHDPAHAPSLGKLIENLRPLARFGVTVIPGNHDYYAGVDAVLDAARKAKARVLVNESYLLKSGDAHIAIVGVDDLWAERLGMDHGPNLTKALNEVPDDAVKLLLCHNPAFFPDAAPHVDLQLSGHTHGGQLHVGWNPAEVILPFGYVEGLYHRGSARLYVNRGFGTAGPPARIGAPPEVTRIVLARS